MIYDKNVKGVQNLLCESFNAYISSIVIICKSLWIKASAKWLNVNVSVNMNMNNMKQEFWGRLYQMFRFLFWKCMQINALDNVHI